jgi:predicted Zn-dependent peptidase
MTEPEQKSERRASIDDGFARTPRIDIIYKIPAGNTPDYYALSLLGQIVASGQSSRLYQKLVKEREVAQGAFGGAQERRGPSLFSFIVLTHLGKDLSEVEKLVYEEIERLKNEPVPDWELEKVRMVLRRQRAQQLQSTLGRAISLGQYAVYYGNPNLINEIEDKYNRVTKEDIQRVARTYFKDTNRTVVTTVPKQRPAPSKPASE